jgi:hypothetical protein
MGARNAGAANRSARLKAAVQLASDALTSLNTSDLGTERELVTLLLPSSLRADQLMP